MNNNNNNIKIESYTVCSMNSDLSAIKNDKDNFDKTLEEHGFDANTRATLFNNHRMYADMVEPLKKAAKSKNEVLITNQEDTIVGLLWALALMTNDISFYYTSLVVDNFSDLLLFLMRRKISVLTEGQFISLQFV